MIEFDFGKLRRTSSRKYVYDTGSDNDVTVVKYIIPCGYASNAVLPGYAHLMEHMYINSNYNYLKKIEFEGARFNAATDREFIEINIIDATDKNILSNSNIIKDDALMNVKFTEKQLELEKKTILQEHDILEKSLGAKKTDYMLGSIDQIKNFSINTLNEINEKFSDKFIRVEFLNHNVNDASIKTEITNHEMTWLENLQIDDVVKNKDSFKINMTDNYSARVLFYVLYIFLDEVLKKGSPYYSLENNKLSIKVPVEYKEFVELINNYKENSIVRYLLKANLSFKGLAKEVENIIFIFDKYFEEYYFKNEMFYFQKWEEVIGDYANE